KMTYQCLEDVALFSVRPVRFVPGLRKIQDATVQCRCPVREWWRNNVEAENVCTRNAGYGVYDDRLGADRFDPGSRERQLRGHYSGRRCHREKYRNQRTPRGIDRIHGRVQCSE